MPASANTSLPTPVPITDNSGSLTVDGSVLVSNFPATQPISGSISVSNFPATQPVSGTFFQATQPVSATTLPLPTGASTEATLALIKAKTDNLDVALSTRTKPGDSQTITGTVASTQSGVWHTVLDRPSLGSGRVYKSAALSNQTTTQTVYTVTAGKTLYIKSLALSGFNTSAVNSGILEVRDNAALRLPVSSPIAGVGALASSVPVSVNIFTFIEPLEFTTNFNITIVQGTLTYSISFVGYEE